ncbi:MAG: arginine N-succinyltransferase [Rickettsiales bacterium]|jgi:arginine N-succinyltransferase|nr:arginine N-succinyltransferase [Rickettsiales bacterium]
MMILRPVTQGDHKEILTLAREAGIGMTSLPPDSKVLERKIARSVASVHQAIEVKKDEAFLFALEDSETKKLVGTCGVVSHVGMKHPFYSYKLSTIVQASDEVGVYSLQRVLHMVNDYTGASEIGSLFLLPDYRRDGIGRFLSRSRFLFVAQFANLFADIMISEIRGVQDEEGHSPFYQNLAQHFFQMDFKRADFVNATTGSQFISDLMPKYPIYVNLLDPKAQAVIGRPFNTSRPAMKLLEAEGFRHQGYVDVFDAGPTLQVETSQIRTVKDSRVLPLGGITALAGKPTHMVCNTKLIDFRAAMAVIQERDGSVTISDETAKALDVTKDDEIRLIEL